MSRHFGVSNPAASAISQASNLVRPNSQVGPVADSQSISTSEDAAVNIVLTASDANGDSLTYVVVDGPSNGVLTGTVPNLVYTPNANYNGSDSFTFQASDGTADSELATISITVAAVNDTPVALAQSVAVSHNTAKAITLVGSDIDGNALTYTVVTNPTNGSLTGTAPNLTYTPNSGYSGSDSFTFRVNDGTANSAAATVTLSVAAAADASFASVSLLLKADGTNGSTSFVDSSVNSLAVSRLGSPTISTTQSRFGGSSAYFDGTDDALRVSSSQCRLSSSYTVETWFYLNSYGVATHGSGIFFNGTTTSDLNRVALSVLPNGGMTAAGFGGSATPIWVAASSAGLVSLNTWTHVAVASDGTTVRLFINGALAASAATSVISTLPNTFHVGLYRSGSALRYLNGYIDDFRITQGIARYTANFTPPGSHPVVDPSFASVSLLMKADGANGSTTFVDSSANAFAISRIGNTTISTAQSRYGGSSAYFDGNGDYLSIPSSASLEFGSGNYTIEMWINPSGGIANATQKYLFGKRQSLSVYGGVIGFLQFNSSLNAYRAYYYATVNGTTWAVSAMTGDIIPANTWTHLAFVRSGSTFTLFVNGTSAANGTASGTIPSNSEPLIIGSTSSADPGANGYAGYIDDLRITKGIARYTANFGFPDSHPTSGS